MRDAKEVAGRACAGDHGGGAANDSALKRGGVHDDGLPDEAVTVRVVPPGAHFGLSIEHRYEAKRHADEGKWREHCFCKRPIRDGDGRGRLHKPGPMDE